MATTIAPAPDFTTWINARTDALIAEAKRNTAGSHLFDWTNLRGFYRDQAMAEYYKLPEVEIDGLESELRQTRSEIAHRVVGRHGDVLKTLHPDDRTIYFVQARRESALYRELIGLLDAIAPGHHREMDPDFYTA